MTAQPPDRPQAGPTHERSGSARWAFWVLGAVAFLGGMALWQPFPAGIWHDDGVYMMLGRALARGEGLQYLGVSGAPPAPKFPPLYPLALAPIWSWAPEVDRAVAGARILNIVLLAVAAGLFGRYLHRRLGASVGWAVALAALGWLAPGLWRVSLIPLSEPLFVLTLVVGLGAAARMEIDADAGSGGWIGAALFLTAFAAAVHVRTAGVALAGAGVLALLAAGRRARAGVVLGASVAVLLPWTLWSGRAAARIPEPLRDVLGPYGRWLTDQVLADPGTYAARLHGEALDLVHRVLVVLLPRVPAWEAWLDPLRWAALVVLVPAFLLGADRIWRRARTPVLLVVVYLAIIWLWPFRDDRLLVPVAPLLVLVVAEGFRWTGEGARLPEGRDAGAAPPAKRHGAPPWLRMGWRGAGLLWAAAFAGISLWTLSGGGVAAGYDVRSRALVQASEAVKAGTAADAVVGAPELWAGLHLYTGRRVSPSARFRPLDPEGPVWGEPGDQLELWEAVGMDHVVVEHGGKVHRATLDALTARCGADAAVAVASWGSAALFRITRDPGCALGP